MSARIAIVDDEVRMGEVLAMVLAGDGHRASAFREPARLLERLTAAPDAFDLVVTDLRMPGMDGLELLTAIRALRDDLPVVLVTAHANVPTAVAALQQGASDFLQKPVDNDALRATVRRCLEHAQLRRENAWLREQVAHDAGFGALVAESVSMQRVVDLALRAACSRATVLITGASGTGKEVLARAIHVHSPRRAGPFQAVNCKALSPGVLESELFGHERGAFTGAARARQGLFERAHGGTVFLDEIGEVDGDFQGKLLRVLQEGEVQRVGADRSTPVDIRVVAATNRDLPAEIDAGRFREDLFFRLAVVPLHLPPLLERCDDVLPLARRFFRRACEAQGRRLTGWSPEVEAYLLRHNWPGNVRELENLIERGVVLARGERIELDDVLLGATPTGRPRDDDAGLGLHAFLDRQAARRIEQALRQSGGARGAAADALGIDRTTLYRWMRKYGLDAPSDD